MEFALSANVVKPGLLFTKEIEIVLVLLNAQLAERLGQDEQRRDSN